LPLSFFRMVRLLWVELFLLSALFKRYCLGVNQKRVAISGPCGELEGRGTYVHPQ
jgi:hypothetical protein